MVENCRTVDLLDQLSDVSPHREVKQGVFGANGEVYGREGGGDAPSKLEGEEKGKNSCEKHYIGCVGVRA